MIAGQDLGGDLVGDQGRAHGTPPPSALPTVTRSGVEAERLEVERRAGAAEAALDLVGDEQRAGARAGGFDRRRELGVIGRTPPSPWIGSTTMAAVADDAAASRAATSPGGTKVTPGISGSKGSR